MQNLLQTEDWAFIDINNFTKLDVKAKNGVTEVKVTIPLEDNEVVTFITNVNEGECDDESNLHSALRVLRLMSQF